MRKFAHTSGTAWLLAGLLLLVSCQSAKKSSSPRPNIIYIMLDDLGYGDFSSYGRSDYQTLYIDSFIRQGMNFINAYAGAPVCTPTRVAFMTGRYPARNEIGLREPLTMSPQDINLGLSAALPTVSSLLKDNGYETALFGKWHLGIQPEHGPLRHGFEHFFGILPGAADYVDHRPVNRSRDIFWKRDQPRLYFNDAPTHREGYFTDLVTEAAIEFVRNDHEKPFFLSLQYTAPHWPFQKPGEGPIPDTVEFQSAGSPEAFAAMMKNLDENIGRLLQAIREAGLEASTLVILTSDNGGERFSSMGPYKGRKMQLWEGGIRVPAAVRWPGVITPGTVSEQPVITMDWTATILAAAACKLPDTLTLDGISLLQHFKRESQPAERKFYWRTSNRVRAHAYRSGDWKYLQTADGEFLFNLRSDPGEQMNLKETERDIFNRLREEFANMDKQMLERLIIEK